jgi:hypothetical protein
MLPKASQPDDLYMVRLRLPTIHEECEKLATRCARENVDHLAYLLQLCELELLNREKYSTQRRLVECNGGNFGGKQKHPGLGGRTCHPPKHGGSTGQAEPVIYEAL